MMRLDASGLRPFKLVALPNPGGAYASPFYRRTGIFRSGAGLFGPKGTHDRGGAGARGQILLAKFAPGTFRTRYQAEWHRIVLMPNLGAFRGGLF
jgi:hypothetical protein